MTDKALSGRLSQLLPAAYAARSASPHIVRRTHIATSPHRGSAAQAFDG
ncbi:MAG TPA: hypothetical protein VND90_07970 [Terracidiphilus sp.]|nr:hypothetical protein [Terracidiphilus sp.]